MAGAPQKNDPQKALEYFQDKLAFTTGPIELNRWIEAGQKVAVIDVRAAEDYDKGHVPGAVNLPKDQWGRLTGLAKDRLNIVYCYSQVCHLAANAAVEFASKGYSVMELEGGFDTWEKYQLPVERATAGAAR